MITLRCSALPLFMKCAGSVRGEVRISPWNDATPLGSAAHDALARYVKGIPVDLPSVAALHGVDEGELSILYYQGVKTWHLVHPIGVSEAQAERDLAAMVNPDLELTGTADVLSRNWSRINTSETGEPGPMSITILDWKTGRRDADHREQLLGYAGLALLNYPEAAYAFGRIAWLRTDETEVYSLTRGDLVPWRERLIAKARETEYRPGPHCEHCPRQFACPARQEMQKGALTVIGSSRGALAELPAAEKIDLYHKAKSVATLASRVLDEIKAAVKDAGPIEADGVKLQMVEESRRTLRPALAWPILQKYLSDDQLGDCVSVSLTKVEDAAASTQPRGQGAKHVRAMVADLNMANAIGTTTIQKLTERRS